MILTFLLVDLAGRPRLPKDLFTRTGTLSMFGYQLYIFLLPQWNWKEVQFSDWRRKPAIVGFTAPLISFVFGMGIKSSLQRHISYSPLHKKSTLTSIVVGQSLTSFAVIYSLINRTQHSQFWIRLTSSLCINMVSDMVSFFLTTFIALDGVYSDGGLNKALTNLSATFVYIIVVAFIIRPLMFRIIKSCEERLCLQTYSFGSHFYCCITNYFGGYLLLGPYIYKGIGYTGRSTVGISYTW